MAIQMEDSDVAKARLTEAKGKVWNLSCRVKQETYNVRASFHVRTEFGQLVKTM